MITLNHVAITCNKREKAKIFFEKILNIPKKYDFKIEPLFTKTLFDIEKEIIIDVYMNESVKVEVFNIDIDVPIFNHICFNVDNIDSILKGCENYKLPVKIGIRDGRKIIFIQDFCKNYYELKANV